MPPTFEIVRFTATDRVELIGFHSGVKFRRCAIFLHGLGGNGYRSRLLPALATACAKKNIGCFSINTRGHDVVAGRIHGTRRSNTNGAVYEIFHECVHDIRGAIQLLRARGVREIFLVGHSTGANKIAYAVQRGVQAARVVYLAPGDDIGIQQKMLGGKKYAAMQKMALRFTRRDPHQLMPVKNLGYLDISAASYQSLFGKKNRMDQFPFRDLTPNAQWRRLVHSPIPACMVLGANDEYLATPAEKIRDFFAAHYPQMPVALIAQANHSFVDCETAMAGAVAKFFAALGD